MSGHGLPSGLSFVQGAVDDPLQEVTVGGALDLAAATWGPRTAVVEFGSGTAQRRWTFDELRLDSLRVAQAGAVPAGRARRRLGGEPPGVGAPA